MMQHHQPTRHRRIPARSRLLFVETLEARLLLFGSGAIQSLSPDAPAAIDEVASLHSIYLPKQHRLSNDGRLLSNATVGDPLPVALNFLAEQAGALQLLPTDLNDYRLTDQYSDEPSGVRHLYLQQTIDGVDVLNANLSLALTAAGEVIHVASSFIGGAYSAARRDAPQISAAQGYLALASKLSFGPHALPQTINGDFTPFGPKISLSAVGMQSVEARLTYVPTLAGLELAWRFDARADEYVHWYDAVVNAATGELLSLDDQVEQATYNVYPRPVQSPLSGTRALVVDPQDAIASPWGWHDTNGVVGAEFNDTRGNNATVQEDTNADNAGGFRPAGGTSLIFDFPLDTAQDPALYQSAAITNAFYWVNLLHDIHYQYGFTEAAGNFQVNNYGHGGAGNDPVIVDIQDGDGGTDSFVAMPDGQSPRMTLYRRTNPFRDRAYDSDILIHEYGHGISERLTGGPGNTSALNAVQSRGMGEGWGDWWALMLEQVVTDAKLDGYPLGNYAAGFPANGPGIRRYPYSFDMAIDPLTLNSFNGGVVNNEQHKAGEIWCSVLWDMNWLLIDKHGFSSDLIHGTGGNNLALQLVMDGLKLQGTNPSYLGARDAILAADVALTGGQNQTEIWTAFARRGMGFSASDGGGAGATTVVQAFDVPATISGRVFRDNDGNGIQNATEPGLAGWTVFRDKNSNGIVDLPTVTTFNSVDTPRAIPDGANTLSSRTVSGLSGVITDINVTVNLTHPYDGELYLTLISPANTPVILANYLGGSGDNYTNTTFDDEAATYISSAAPPFTGSFKPFFDLAQLDGRDPNGTWKLRMDDAVSGNTGTLLSWSIQISYGTPDPTTVTDANGNYSFFGISNATHRIREVAQPGFTPTTPIAGYYDVAIVGGQPVSERNFGNTPATFHVSNETQTSTGAVVILSRDVNVAPLNLYDVQGDLFGPPDLTLVGATVGSVKGSLIIDPNLRRLTFVKTNGVLSPDTYTLTLRSAANGFQDTSGSVLDGDANGLAGGDFVTTFTVAAIPAGVVVVQVPNFARGPEQSVNVPASDSSGIPLSFSNGAGITTAMFEIRFNPALLEITAASVAPGLPVGVSVNLNTNTPGVAVLQFNSPTPLAAGTTPFVYLQATVPNSASYRAKQVLDITNVVLNGGVIPALDDDGVHVVGYFGDVTANGTYSAQDASIVARLAVGIENGLEQFKLLDPTIIGDISGNGMFSATDTSKMLQAAVGIAVQELPTRPQNISLLAGGPDPKLSIPRSLVAAAGQLLKIPIEIDSIVNLTGTGLDSADLVIYYDPTVLEINGATLGGLVSQLSGWLISTRIDPLAGRIDLSLAGTSPLEGQFQGELVQLKAKVKDNAPAGGSAINLAATSRSRSTQLNEGFLTLIPPPTDAANDGIDGLVTITASNNTSAQSSVQRIGEQLLIFGTAGNDRIMVSHLDAHRIRVRIGNQLLGTFTTPQGIAIDGLAGEDFIYVSPMAPATVITLHEGSIDHGLIFVAANTKLTDTIPNNLNPCGAGAFADGNIDTRDSAILELLANWQDDLRFATELARL